MISPSIPTLSDSRRCDEHYQIIFTACAFRMAAIQKLSAYQSAAPICFPNKPSVNFIDNRLCQTDPKFQSMTGIYEPTLDLYVPNHDSLQLNSREQLFKDAIQSFLGSKKGSKVSFDRSQHLTWEDVLKEVKLTQDKYQGRTDGGILPDLRGKLRSFSNHTGAVESWMKLLPTQSWQGSLVCGGLTIVLKAARELGKMREEICEAIEQIPETISNTQALASLYQGQTLHLHALRLYVAIMDILQLSINWYEEKPLRKVGLAIFKGSDYPRQLSLKLQELRSLESRIDKQSFIHQQMDQARNSEETAEILNGVRSLLMDSQRNSNYQAEIDRLRNELAQSEQRKHILINKERKTMLLCILRYSKIMALGDLEATLSVLPTAHGAAQDRAAWILKSREVAEWLGSLQSRVLIINGGEPEHSTRSATSLFTSMLVRALDTTKPGVSIYWFCGQNISYPIQKMLRGLAGQLIDQSSTSVDLPSPSDLGSAQDIRDLTWLLCRCLVEQLQQTPVYCVLDAVSFYEDQYRSDDLYFAFRRVVGIVARSQPSLSHRLKVLVTSPTRVLDLSETIAAMDATVLDVPYEVAGSMYGLRDEDIFQSTRAKLLYSS